jgi:hypothetical protein
VQRQLTRQPRHHIQQLLLVHPLRRLAHAPEERIDKLLLIRSHVVAGIDPRRALPEERRCVRHDADNMRRAPVARPGPFPQAAQGDPRRDADDDGQLRALRPRRAQLPAHALRHLWLDRDDDQVRPCARLDVRRRRPHPLAGKLVPVDVPRLRDGDVLFVDALRCEAFDDRGGHVAAADEGKLAFLQGRHCRGVLPSRV